MQSVIQLDQDQDPEPLFVWKKTTKTQSQELMERSVQTLNQLRSKFVLQPMERRYDYDDW